MSQETITLIIGAIIGSVSPLLILLVTLYFQNKREIRARQWELEDRQWNRRLRNIVGCDCKVTSPCYTDEN